jgi:hypothetical protein
VKTKHQEPSKVGSFAVLGTSLIGLAVVLYYFVARVNLVIAISAKTNNAFWDIVFDLPHLIHFSIIAVGILGFFSLLLNHFKTLDS